ncbi:hypothetical protein TgHK011_001627 [Trichoderma gracile]|nr:hypothetical protein TgHK011_001627 [Trichoderma gracile]
MWAHALGALVSPASVGAAAVRVQGAASAPAGLGGPRQRRKALEHSARLEGRVPEGLAGEGAAFLTGRGDGPMRKAGGSQQSSNVYPWLGDEARVWPVAFKLELFVHYGKAGDLSEMAASLRLVTTSDEPSHKSHLDKKGDASEPHFSPRERDPNGQPCADVIGPPLPGGASGHDGILGPMDLTALHVFRYLCLLYHGVNNRNST